MLLNIVDRIKMEKNGLENLYCKNEELENLRNLMFALSDMNFSIPEGSVGKYGAYFISGEAILACENTIKSIDYCCTQGFFADAFTLARKYRDDLMQYLFVSYIISNIQGQTEEEIQATYGAELTPESLIAMVTQEIYILKSGNRKSDMELAVESWIYGNLENEEYCEKRRKYFDTSKYKKHLENHPCVKTLMTKYLKKIWKDTNRILNNYVHANGLKYITSNYAANNEYETQKEALIKTIRNITSIFLSILIIIDGRKVQSSDYRDAMECECIPEDGCQYWVMPGVVEYIDKNFKKFHPDLVDFLSKNDPYGMKLKLSDYEE